MRSVSSTVGSAWSTTGTSTAAGRIGRMSAMRLQHRIEVVIAARRHVRIGERRRHVHGQARARELEELVARDRPFRGGRLHQANSFKASAGAMAKKAPCDTTPNMRRPSTSRSSPSATRS